MAACVMARVSGGPDSSRSMLFPPLLGKWLPRRRTGAFNLMILRGKQEDKCSPPASHRPGNAITLHPPDQTSSMICWNTDQQKYVSWNANVL